MLTINMIALNILTDKIVVYNVNYFHHWFMKIYPNIFFNIKLQDPQNNCKAAKKAALVNLIAYG